MPVSANPAVAGQFYGVQVIPVEEPVHEIDGSVHPALDNAVAARTKPRTTLYFKRDMNHSHPLRRTDYARGKL